MERATQLGQSASWGEVIGLLETSVQEDDAENAAAWFLLMRAYEQTERWDDVVHAATKALELGHPQPGRLHMAKAQALAADDRTEAAVAELEQAAAQGSNRPLLRFANQSPSLRSLFGNPRVAALMKTLTPCTSEPYRQFDFWLGDFEVENPAGVVVGENEITEHLDGCMLLESWTSGTGMLGMSFNFYDPSDDTWNQVFVDNNGLPANWPPLKGKLEDDGSMVLWSPEGATRSRWTWSRVDGGKVRQMAEQTTDGGKTWQVVWDSYYVPKSASADGADQ